jgi:hypothetical protein
VRAALRTLAGTLHGRKRLLVSSLEDYIEDFLEQLSQAQTNSISPVQTAIIGQLMDNSYHAAIMESGKQTYNHSYESLDPPILLPENVVLHLT